MFCTCVNKIDTQVLRINFQFSILNSQFLLITLPLEHQRGALLERYCEEHSSGFDNLNH